MPELVKSFAGEFGKTFISMVWDDTNLTENLNRGPEKVNKELEAILSFYAPEIENWMKNNAPWRDDTGAARNGLAARPFSESGSHGIVLYHQVPYGIWLEVRFSGRYAIITPALQEWGPRVMEGCRGMLNDLGKR